MPFNNPAKKLEYQREWYAARRAKGVEYLGGKCAHCGTTKALEFDHIDPATKWKHRIWSYSWKRITEELAKCQLLCAGCHEVKTIAFISTAGGTWRTRKNHHKKGCGCRSCRAMREAEVATVFQNRQRIESPQPIKSDHIRPIKSRREEEVWAS